MILLRASLLKRHQWVSFAYKTSLCIRGTSLLRASLLKRHPYGSLLHTRRLFAHEARLFCTIDVSFAKQTSRQHWNTPQHTAAHCITLHRTAPHCTTLHHTASHCITLKESTGHEPPPTHCKAHCFPHPIGKRDLHTHSFLCGVATVSRIDKLQVSSAEYRLFYGALLQKRPTTLSILLTEATPFRTPMG